MTGGDGRDRVRRSMYKKVKLGTLKGTRRYTPQKTLRRKEIWHK
jgi:hypothetical protein